jgi:arginase family enzyme
MVGPLGNLTEMITRDVVLIGVPTNSSGTADGVARAPGVLRERGLAAALAGRPGFTDAGDLALAAPRPRRGPSGLLAEDALIVMIGQVREAVGAARERGRFPLLIGGDCPVILGALAALQAGAGEPGLLFVDGHEDAWPPRASPTGEAADCELGLALRMFDDALDPRLRAVLPRIRAGNVIAAGPRDGGTAGAVVAAHGPRCARHHRACRCRLPAARRPDLAAAGPAHLGGPRHGGLRGLVGVHLQPGSGPPPGGCRRHHRLPHPGDHRGGPPAAAGIAAAPGRVAGRDATT